MHVSKSVLLALAFAASSSAFAPQFNNGGGSRTALQSTESMMDPDLSAMIAKELDYKPGEADTAFARKYKHLVGAQIKTVGESFAEFTKELGYSVNPLYKNMVTDLVGTTHLVVVNARFQQDAIWSLGMMTTLHVLFKNYPEPEIADKIKSALFKSVGLDEAKIVAEAKSLEEWVSSQTKESIEAALGGEGDSPVAQIAKSVKSEPLWMYSRYFGIGLIRLMEGVGIEMDKDEVYPVMEKWMSEKLGVGHITACSDSDLYFKIKAKLDMMETMMKEIEIREKKRMAERLELKAEAALRAADRELKLQAEIEAEAQAQRERVAASTSS
ncbi:hypothetical protein MPSEU_000972100 [Mayamaea pseudoterrestris]|nr:hypothetical protein MPSEU_000972100 [Mayamaea pseudoterrestris]